MKIKKRFSPLEVLVIMVVLFGLGFALGSWVRKASSEPFKEVAISGPSVTPTLIKDFETTIEIRGDEECERDTKRALNYLATRVKEHYERVVKYVGIIECADKGSGMYAYEDPPRYKVGDSTRNAGTEWYAGTIVHDTCHSQLYHDYLNSHPDEEYVPSNIWTGRDAEIKCLDIQHEALSKAGASQSSLDWILKSKETEYWEVPYEERWW